MQLSPYVNFNGQCESAFKFYEQCLGGKIVAMSTYAGSPMAEQVPSEWRDKIIHARLRVGDNLLMGSDSPPGHFEKPQGVSITLGIDDPADAERVFHALAEKWFAEWDKDKMGIVNGDQLRAGINSTLTPPGFGPPPGAGGRGPGMNLQGAEGKRNGLASAMGIEFKYVHADLEVEGHVLFDPAADGAVLAVELLLVLLGGERLPVRTREGELALETGPPVGDLGERRRRRAGRGAGRGRSQDQCRERGDHGRRERANSHDGSPRKARRQGLRGPVVERSLTAIPSVV